MTDYMFVLCVYHFGVGFKPILKFVFFLLFRAIIPAKKAETEKIKLQHLSAIARKSVDKI